MLTPDQTTTAIALLQIGLQHVGPLAANHEEHERIVRTGLNVLDVLRRGEQNKDQSDA